MTKETYYKLKAQNKAKHPKEVVLDARVSIARAKLPFESMKLSSVKKTKQFNHKWAGLPMYQPKKKVGMTSRYAHKPWPFTRKTKVA